MAEQRGKGIAWLNNHLTRKALLALVFICVLSLGLMVWTYRNYVSNSAGGLYGRASREPELMLKDVCDVLTASGGDPSVLDKYVRTRDIFCEVRRDDGEVYSRLYGDNGGSPVISASCSGTAVLSDGSALDVTVWSKPFGLAEVTAYMLHASSLGIILMTVGIFALVAVVMYFLVLAPIKKLRRTIGSFDASGAVPERTSRRDELGKLQNTYADMVDSLKAKEHDEHRLIASISHDIRTPLTSVMGYSERLLSAEFPPEKQRRYLNNVYDKAVAIKSVVDEFDDYIEMGMRDDFPMQAMTVAELCASLEREYRDELADANVDFDIDCRCPKKQIRCNYDRMRRFFGNLISNSIQHSGAEHLKLRLIFEYEDGHVLLTFADNGRGVPPELAGDIFEPFFTSDKGRKVSGLGLSICKSIINSHGGTIRAENLPSGGLAILASLPCA